MRSILSFALSAVLLLFLSACDSNGSNDDDNGGQPGSFTMEISGDADVSADGYAFFGEAEDPETGDDVFVLYFSDTQNVNSQSGQWGFIGRNSDRPGEGTFSVADVDQGDEDIPEDEFVMITSFGGSETSPITYVSTGGELRISESSSNRMEGSFDIQAQGFDFSGGEELSVSIEGTFNAVGSDQVFVPFSQ